MHATSTWEVPRDHWAAFLDKVEALQRDKPVELELVGTFGDQTLARNASLRSISVPGKGSSAGTIELDLGVGGGQLDHRVFQPVHLYAVQAASGQLECLDIEDERHMKTLIRFKEPVHLPAGPAGAPMAAREVLVREHMTSPARVLATGSSVAEAFQLMQQHGIRHLPVVSSDGKLVGLVSDRELFLAKKQLGIPASDVTVDEVMARSPYAVSPLTSLDEAASVMALRKYGCTVIVEDERPVGILTTIDALRALAQCRAEERSEGRA